MDFQFPVPSRIETARFILERLHPAFLAYKTFHWTKQADSFDFVGWNAKHMNLWRWYRHLRSRSRKNNQCRAIVSKESRECIGIHIMRFNNGMRTASETIYVGELPWRGKGIQLEVSSAIIDYCFITYPLKRITSYIAARNVVSIKNTFALGYKLEGTIRNDFLLSNGESVDRLIFGMLKSDWQERNAGSEGGGSSIAASSPPTLTRPSGSK